MNAKSQFLMTPHAEKLRSLLAQDYFREALNYAMLEMIETQPGAFDPTKGWDSHSQTQGALRFRGILETIALPEPEKPKATSAQLNYKAYDNDRRNH